ncbi:hypothetical protein GA0074696_3470 [Micromonospora purpureochromogenes]|uniref:Uncharacterized protein n=1 Tax=Micromonospora purpureochromogenes TaxID=47872 RepID=A0A1C4YKS3_9ACTN|nr:hypothetical protein [Micromonospora purpureochromogenes]SCF21329.1 hypothetical protein GA0074696_3470 [Micromonospora purpureochromogenes]
MAHRESVPAAEQDQAQYVHLKPLGLRDVFAGGLLERIPAAWPPVRPPAPTAPVSPPSA